MFKVSKLEVDFCSVLFYFLCFSVLFGLDCWGGGGGVLGWIMPLIYKCSETVTPVTSDLSNLLSKVDAVLLPYFVYRLSVLLT